jgi:hypothetical protein
MSSDAEKRAFYALLSRYSDQSYRFMGSVLFLPDLHLKYLSWILNDKNAAVCIIPIMALRWMITCHRLASSQDDFATV